jgi:glyoxylase-like metal-dependent hydrolase (beta-lactamase superfamily II)
LIAGDHVVGFGSAVLDPVCGDMSDYISSCNKLIQLNANIIFPAHGPPNYDPNGLLRNYIAHRTKR